MADILMDNQTAPTTPAAGKSILWNDSTVKRPVHTDDTGAHHGILSRNTATAAQGLLATTEVYLTSSNILIPSFGLTAGMLMVWYIQVVKTAASTAAPIWTWRVGAAGAIGDTSRIAATSTQAQTAVASDGTLIATCTVRTGGASGVLVGAGPCGAPGFGGGGLLASSTFDLTTLGGQYIGLTVTTGTSAAWTVNGLSCYLFA
jgi:hypothetical protein